MKKKHKLSINYEEDLENIPVQKSFFLCGFFFVVDLFPSWL